MKVVVVHTTTTNAINRFIGGFKQMYINIVESSFGTIYANVDADPSDESKAFDGRTPGDEDFEHMLRETLVGDEIEIKVSYSDYSNSYKCQAYDKTVPWKQRVVLTYDHEWPFLAILLIVYVVRDVLDGIITKESVEKLTESDFDFGQQALPGNEF